MAHSIGPRLSDDEKVVTTRKKKRRKRHKKKKGKKKSMDGLSPPTPHALGGSLRVDQHNVVRSYNFNEDLDQQYRDRFYSRVTRPFFMAYAWHQKMKRELIELIIKFCCEANDDGRRRELCGVRNVFSDEQCYFNALYSYN